MRALELIVRTAEKDRHHGSQQIRHCGPGFRQRLVEAASGKTFVYHQLCVVQQGLEKGVQCIGMEQRQACIQHIPGAHL
ncbi:hypothetical protein D3C79_948520 [compost metagenome]